MRVQLYDLQRRDTGDERQMVVNSPSRIALKATCDAGLKAQSLESGLLVISGRDDIQYIKCSDEHGVIADPDNVLKLNDKLKLMPGHCDPTCNVYDWYVGIRDGKVECLWPVTAGGMAY